MPRLTSDEAAKLKLQLVQWQPPAAMSQLVEGAITRIGSTNFFNQAGIGFLRDGWIASHFGMIRNADDIRLIQDTWPDLQMRAGKQIEAFEAVEADDPDRRRGDEYSDGLREIEDDPPEEWAKSAANAFLWLKRACSKKIAKRYGAPTNLLIYLNLNEYGCYQRQVVRCFPMATAEAGRSFEQVWILWKEVSYLVWSCGNIRMSSAAARQIDF